MPLFDQSVRATSLNHRTQAYQGLMHIADWRATIAGGEAKGRLVFRLGQVVLNPELIGCVRPRADTRARGQMFGKYAVSIAYH